MQKIVLELDVQGNELDQLNSDLSKTEKQFKETQTAADKTSKSLKDVGENGGAIAILDELTGGLATKVRDAAEASKLFSISLKGVKTALIATGIGAFVVGVGLLVSYWDDIQDAITGINAKLETQLKDLEQAQELTSGRLGLIEKELELAELQGKSNEELQKQRIRLLEQLQAEQQKEIEILELKAARLKASAEDVKLHERLYVTLLNSLNANSGDLWYAQNRLEMSREYKEIQDAILKAKNEELSTEIALYKIRNPEGEGGFTPQVALVNGLTPEGIVELTSFEALENAKTRVLKEQGDARIAIANMEFEARKAAQMQYLGFLQTASALAGKETAAGKALAVAAALASTYVSAQQAYQSQLTIPTPDAPVRASIAAAVAVASGLANVKQILSVKVPGGGGGGGSIPGGRGQAGGVQPPSFNVVGNTGINQIGEAIGMQNSKPVQAYVLQSDIEAGQDLKRNAIGSASLG